MSLPRAMKTCMVLILRQSCIVSTSNRMPSRSNNSSDASDLILWRQSKMTSRNSSNVTSFERNITHTGLLILQLFLKRTKISESVLTSVILIQPVLRMNFHYLSRMSSLKTRVVSKRCLLWMAFQGTTKSSCTQMMKSIQHSEHCQLCFVIRLFHLA